MERTKTESSPNTAKLKSSPKPEVSPRKASENVEVKPEAMEENGEKNGKQPENEEENEIEKRKSQRGRELRNMSRKNPSRKLRLKTFFLEKKQPNGLCNVREIENKVLQKFIQQKVNQLFEWNKTKKLSQAGVLLSTQVFDQNRKVLKPSKKLLLGKV